MKDNSKKVIIILCLVLGIVVAIVLMSISNPYDGTLTTTEAIAISIFIGVLISLFTI